MENQRGKRKKIHYFENSKRGGWRLCLSFGLTSPFQDEKNVTQMLHFCRQITDGHWSTKKQDFNAQDRKIKRKKRSVKSKTKNSYHNICLLMGFFICLN